MHVFVARSGRLLFVSPQGPERAYRLPYELLESSTFTVHPALPLCAFLDRADGRLVVFDLERGRELARHDRAFAPRSIASIAFVRRGPGALAFTTDRHVCVWAYALGGERCDRGGRCARNRHFLHRPPAVFHALRQSNARVENKYRSEWDAMYGPRPSGRGATLRSILRRDTREQFWLPEGFAELPPEPAPAPGSAPAPAPAPAPTPARAAELAELAAERAAWLSEGDAAPVRAQRPLLVLASEEDWSPFALAHPRRARPAAAAPPREFALLRQDDRSALWDLRAGRVRAIPGARDLAPVDADGLPHAGSTLCYSEYLLADAGPGELLCLPLPRAPDAPLAPRRIRLGPEAWNGFGATHCLGRLGRPDAVVRPLRRRLLRALL